MGFLTGSPSQQQSSSTSSMLSGNLAFPTVSQSTAPSLGMPSAAGSMMAQILGVPGFGTNPNNPAPTVSPGSTVGGPITPVGGVPSIINTPGIFNPAPGGGVPLTGSPDTAKTFVGAPIGQEDLFNGFGSNDGSIGSHLSHTIDGINNGSNPNTSFVSGAPTGPINSGVPAGFPGGSPATNPDAGAPTPVGGTPSAGSALDNFSNSAGMDFIRNQGVKAIDASQAGKGMLDSGATGQALSDYGTNLGKTYLNNYLQDLGSLASVGQNQTNSLVDAGRTMATSGSSSGSGTGAKQGLLPMLIQSAGQAASAFA